MDFYEAFELGLCNDCDQDPIQCEACFKCAYSDDDDNTDKEVVYENVEV